MMSPSGGDGETQDQSSTLADEMMSPDRSDGETQDQSGAICSVLNHVTECPFFFLTYGTLGSLMLIKSESHHIKTVNRI